VDFLDLHVSIPSAFPFIGGMARRRSTVSSVERTRTRPEAGEHQQAPEDGDILRKWLSWLPYCAGVELPGAMRRRVAIATNATRSHATTGCYPMMSRIAPPISTAIASATTPRAPEIRAWRNAVPEVDNLADADNEKHRGDQDSP
jgi:hypothetical protein